MDVKGNSKSERQNGDYMFRMGKGSSVQVILGRNRRGKTTSSWESGDSGDTRGRVIGSWLRRGITRGKACSQPTRAEKGCEGRHDAGQERTAAREPKRCYQTYLKVVHITNESQ